MNTAIYIIILVFFAALFLLIPNKNKTKIIGISFLLAVVLLEVFVFNFKSITTLGSSAEVLFSEEDLKEGYTDVSDVTVTAEGLDMKISSLYFDVSFSEKDGKVARCEYIKYAVSAMDETRTMNYRADIKNDMIINGDEESAYAKINLSGNASAIKIRFTTNKDAKFTIKSITANVTVPFEFSYLRLIIIAGLPTLVYILVTLEKLKKPFGENKKFANVITVVITLCLVITSAAMVMSYNVSKTGSAFSDYGSKNGTQINKEIVDAFRAGQVSLLDEPSEELLAMENPYDWNARTTQKVSAKWDHLLYNGKYYSYYGIGPVLILFLPYNLITDCYFPTPASVFIFGSLGILFLSALFYEFTRKFFPKISLSVFISALLVLQFTSNVWYNFITPQFYEISQSAGFMFVTAGAYFLIKSEVLTKNKIRMRYLALSAVFMAMAVLSRPTTALYCVCAVLIIAIDLIKRIKRKELKPGKIVLYLVAALTGYIVLGGVQVIYNYMRFGSFTDFGIQYSLTINDFTNAEFHPDLTLPGFYNYLFAPPLIKSEFPYIFSNYSNLNVSGYYFAANKTAVGIFFFALPSLGYVYLPPVLRTAKKEQILTYLPVLISVCVICPIIIIASIWEYGYSVRYSSDFNWQITLGGMSLIFLYKKEKTSRVFFACSAVFALLVVVALVIGHMGISETSGFLGLKKLFEFTH